MTQKYSGELKDPLKVRVITSTGAVLFWGGLIVLCFQILGYLMTGDWLEVNLLLFVGVLQILRPSREPLPSGSVPEPTIPLGLRPSGYSPTKRSAFSETFFLPKQNIWPVLSAWDPIFPNPYRGVCRLGGK